MRHRITSCVLLLLVSVAVTAQQSRLQGYAYAAPGASVFGSGSGSSTAVFGYGSGLEWFIAKGLTVGGEAGALVSRSNSGVPNGILSGDGTYYFNKSVNKVAPFIVGGYSWAAGCGCRTDPTTFTRVCAFPYYSNGANFGGGATWWRKRYGLRLEFRDHYFPGNGGASILSFRIGFTARKL